MNPLTVIQIQAKARLSFSAWRGETGMWVAYCRPLGITAEGHTWGEMMEEANEAVALLLMDLFESGELDTFLRQRGWVANMPMRVNPRHVAFDLPFFLEQVDGPVDPDRATA